MLWATRARQESLPAATSGIEWIDLKAGKIELGPPDHRRTAELKQPIRISAAPITCSQYARFLGATKRTPPQIPKDDPLFEKLSAVFQWEDTRPPKGHEDWPVSLVSFADAEAYCQWLTRVTGRTYRLPTKAELEFALGDAWYTGQSPEVWLGEGKNVSWYGLGPVGPKKVLSKAGLQCFPSALFEWTSEDWVSSGNSGERPGPGATHGYGMKGPGRRLHVYGIRVVTETAVDAASAP